MARGEAGSRTQITGSVANYRSGRPRRFRFPLPSVLVTVLVFLALTVLPARADWLFEDLNAPKGQTDATDATDEPSTGTKADKSSVCGAAATQGFLVSWPNATEQVSDLKSVATGDWITTPTQPPLQLLATCINCLERHFEREGDLLKLMKGIVRREIATVESALVIDVGANHGAYTLVAAALDADVVAVEPQKGMIANIVASAERNRLGPRIHVHQNAILDIRGGARITAGEGVADGGLATVAMADAGEGDFCALTLDDVIRNRVVSFVKIDVEGTELRVLRSSFRSFAASLVRNVLVEFGPPRKWMEVSQQTNRDAMTVLSKMQRLGFQMWLTPSKCAERVREEIDTPTTKVHGVPLARIARTSLRQFLRVMNASDLECHILWTQPDRRRGEAAREEPTRRKESVRDDVFERRRDREAGRGEAPVRRREADSTKDDPVQGRREAVKEEAPTHAPREEAFERRKESVTDKPPLRRRSFFRRSNEATVDELIERRKDPKIEKPRRPEY